MPTCAVIGCSNRKGEDKLRFFKFPSARENAAPDVQAVCKKRRELWKIAINRDFTEDQWDKKVVCQDHFIGGLCPFRFLP